MASLFSAIANVLSSPSSSSPATPPASPTQRKTAASPSPKAPPAKPASPKAVKAKGKKPAAKGRPAPAPAPKTASLPAVHHNPNANKLADGSVFEGVWNPDTLLPVHGKATMADGSTMEGDFNHEGKFCRGTYITADTTAVGDFAYVPSSTLPRLKMGKLSKGDMSWEGEFDMESTRGFLRVGVRTTKAAIEEGLFQEQPGGKTLALVSGKQTMIASKIVFQGTFDPVTGHRIQGREVLPTGTVNEGIWAWNGKQNVLVDGTTQNATGTFKGIRTYGGSWLAGEYQPVKGTVLLGTFTTVNDAQGGKICKLSQGLLLDKELGTSREGNCVTVSGLTHLSSGRVCKKDVPPPHIQKFFSRLKVGDLYEGKTVKSITYRNQVEGDMGTVLRSIPNPKSPMWTRVVAGTRRWVRVLELELEVDTVKQEPASSDTTVPTVSNPSEARAESAPLHELPRTPPPQSPPTESDGSFGVVNEARIADDEEEEVYTSTYKRNTSPPSPLAEARKSSSPTVVAPPTPSVLTVADEIVSELVNEEPSVGLRVLQDGCPAVRWIIADPKLDDQLEESTRVAIERAYLCGETIFPLPQAFHGDVIRFTEMTTKEGVPVLRMNLTVTRAHFIGSGGGTGHAAARCYSPPPNIRFAMPFYLWTVVKDMSTPNREYLSPRFTMELEAQYYESIKSQLAKSASSEGKDEASEPLTTTIDATVGNQTLRHDDALVHAVGGLDKLPPSKGTIQFAEEPRRYLSLPNAEDPAASPTKISIFREPVTVETALQSATYLMSYVLLNTSKGAEDPGEVDGFKLQYPPFKSSLTPLMALSDPLDLPLLPDWSEDLLKQHLVSIAHFKYATVLFSDEDYSDPRLRSALLPYFPFDATMSFGDWPLDRDDVPEGFVRCRFFGDVNSIDSCCYMALRWAQNEAKYKPPKNWFTSKQTRAAIIEEEKANKYRFLLREGTAEWNEVKTSFTQRFGKTVLKIERVQNTELYEKYLIHKAQIAKENHGDANEIRWMFHGTRTTDPELICTEGFDMRFCEKGFYGRASYFAFDAAYSHNFRHTKPDGSASMFLTLVCCGLIDERQQKDENIKRPDPPCHSVKGPVTPGGMKAVMIYDLNQAYPSYLVHYTP